MSYLFGDSPTARQRLDVLAQTFQGPTREFLSGFTPPASNLAVDLGCGPGHTTHLIAELMPFQRVVGLDSSESFVESASECSGSRVSFLTHDVTATPFPTPPADLMFCRFLLPHLPDPARALTRWASQLSGSGVALLEEVHWIVTENPVFDSYLKALTRVLEAQSMELYAGARLPKLLNGSGLQVASDDTRRLRVANRDAAAMFSMNIRAWGPTAQALELYETKFLGSLHSELVAIAEGASNGQSEIAWGMRQVVLTPR